METKKNFYADWRFKKKKIELRLFFLVLLPELKLASGQFGCEK